MELKQPGFCVFCNRQIPTEIISICPESEVCGAACRMMVIMLDPHKLREIIETKFVDDQDRQDYLARLNALISEESDNYIQNEPEDFPRPMGVTEPPKTIRGPIKPSRSTFIAGNTDAEVAQHLLMVTWGTVAK